jgi:O-succinylbenzoic acid--CoA ligase
MTGDSLHKKYKVLTVDGCSFNGFEAINKLVDTLKSGGDKEKASIAEFLIEWFDDSDTIQLHTSGSTGKPKQIVVKKKAMLASAKKTIQFLQLTEGATALLCLSANYIAGKMMIVRALLGRFNLLLGNVASNPLQKNQQKIDFAAMVPMQVYQVLKENHDALKQINHLIIGGGSLNRTCVKQLRKMDVNAWETYGMTETVSHIAMRSIKLYDKGFQLLPNVKISVDERQCLVVEASDVNDQKLVTNDLVEVDSHNRFTIKGRYDNIINSGGVKLVPEIIESKLQNQIQFDFIISSKADEVLGQKLVLVLESKNREAFIDPDYSILKRFEIPKELVFIDEFPRTESGKLHRIKTKLLLE